jgi:hypothetical protein
LELPKRLRLFYFEDRCGHDVLDALGGADDLFIPRGSSSICPTEVDPSLSDVDGSHRHVLRRSELPTAVGGPPRRRMNIVYVRERWIRGLPPR